MKTTLILSAVALSAITTFAKEPVSTGPVTAAAPDLSWEISAVCSGRK